MSDFQIRIEVRPVSSEGPSRPSPENQSSEGRRGAFWDSVFEARTTRFDGLRSSTETHEGYLYLERTLTNEFGYRLTAAIDARLMQRNEQARFAFRVSELEYGSLELGISVSGIKALAEACGGDLGFFTSLVEQYTPDAFTESVFRSGWPDSLKAATLATMTPGPTLTRAFTASAPPELAPGDPAEQRFARAWRAANTSLLVPVILALLVCFVAANWLADERAAQAKREAEFMKLVTTREAACYQHVEQLMDSGSSRRPAASSAAAAQAKTTPTIAREP
jgi:hypothetical protein